ncbi:MAG TPA: hypothetical protein VFO60_04960, partial [Candidatus Dormibacteraeota bacterium]|nr:hypothetical protein [Candidatus Dormibacteraeota bacterium]
VRHLGRRAGRAAVAAAAAGVATALVLAYPADAAAETRGGALAGDAALRLSAAAAALPPLDGDIRLAAQAWQAAGVQLPDRGALAAGADPGGRGGGGRGDQAAGSLAAASCGGAVSWTWEVDPADRPEQGDLVLYRPPPGADGLPGAYRVGVVATETEVVVVQRSRGADRAVAVRRELLFHAMRATAGDAAVADPTTETGFCRVSPALMPPAMRVAQPVAGRIALVDPAGVAATVEWNAAHPHNRDGNLGVARMIEALAFLGAGSGALVGLVVFGGAAIHDGSTGLLRGLTAIFAVARGALTMTVDGTWPHRVLAVALLALAAWKLAHAPLGVTAGLAVAAGAAVGLELATRGRVRVATLLGVFAWSLASYAVGALTGFDGTDHDSMVTIALAVLGDTAIVVAGGRLGVLLGPVGTALASSVAGRRAVALGIWVRDHPVTAAAGGLPGVRAAVGATHALVTAGQGTLARLGNMLGAKVSSFLPSATEASHAASRLAGEAMTAEVAPRTVAEAVSGARAASLGSPTLWAVVRGDVYSLSLRGMDVATWFTWRGASVAGDLLSMQGELAEWIAGRLSGGHITHPFVQAMDRLLGHLDPATRRRVLEVTLPAMADVSRLGNLHTGGQLAGGVLSGHIPLPVPVPPPPSVTPAGVAATLRPPASPGHPRLRPD